MMFGLEKPVKMDLSSPPSKPLLAKVESKVLIPDTEHFEEQMKLSDKPKSSRSNLKSNKGSSKS